MEERRGKARQRQVCMKEKSGVETKTEQVICMQIIYELDLLLSKYIC